MGERFLAERLLEERSASDLMLYDRGFPSFALFALHRHLDRAFCARLPLHFCREVSAFLESWDTDAIVEWAASADPKRDCAQVGIPADPLRLRLLRVPLPGGTFEVLATNLFDAEAFPAHLFKDLYRCRWAVEEAFKALKPALRVEQFRTQGVLGVYQEVYARFLTLTLASIARVLTEILGIHDFGDQAADIGHIGQAIMAQQGEANHLIDFANTTFNDPTMAKA
jgi:hypothetical protein